MSNLGETGTHLSIKEAALSRSRITGLTHNFYRYPARFPPTLIRELITKFTSPGDLVVDPFSGGGTSAVEARVTGRKFLGFDINQLAIFVALAKTTPLTPANIASVEYWASQIDDCIKLNRKTSNLSGTNSYHRNINDHQFWPIKKALQLSLESIGCVDVAVERFIRCCILNATQHAIDGKKHIPSVAEFRDRLKQVTTRMLEDMSAYAKAVCTADRRWDANGQQRTRLLCRSAKGLEKLGYFDVGHRPKLIVTSPPYPGVHVLYHRWQVLGRRETPLPYWIAGATDGSGASFYTFGDRNNPSLEDYFVNAFETFRSIALISDSSTTIAQVVGFSEPNWQLPRYLETMEEAGLVEVNFEQLATRDDGRLWRQVPNRKWHANSKGATHGSQEVILFHRRSTRLKGSV